MSEARLPRGAKGEAPQYFDEPEVGGVLAMVVALTGELAVMRDRLDTVERLLDTGEPVTREAIARYVPGEAVRAERDAWRQQLLAIVFRGVHEERERLAREPAPRYEDVVRGVEGE